MNVRATLRTLATAASVGLLAACMPPQGPHVRVATATPAELAAVRDQDNVWYEFEAGDVIPLQLGFVGAIQGGTMDRGGVVRAKRKLYFVMKKNAPMQISFDGKSFASPDSSKFVVAVAPREGQPAGELVWIIYIGESGNVQEALEAEIKDAKSGTKRLVRGASEGHPPGKGASDYGLRTTGYSAEGERTLRASSAWSLEPGARSPASSSGGLQSKSRHEGLSSRPVGGRRSSRTAVAALRRAV